MSIRSVDRVITRALEDNKLTTAEAEAIVKEAEKGPVTTGEARAVADLYEKGQWFMPNTFPQGALPQPRPPMYEMEAGAGSALMSFFVAQRVPQGATYGLVKEDIEAALKTVDLSSKQLDAAPKGLKNLHPVFLRDSRPVDGDRQDAYVDTQKHQFYVKSTGAGMAGPDSVGPFWYGPFALQELSAADRVKEKVDAWDLAQKLSLNTTRTHTPRVTDVAANDDGTFTVTLSAINWRDPSDVRDTKRAVVDAEGTFLRAAGGIDANEVADKIDLFAAADAIGLKWNRSYTPHVGEINAREDGNFDVRLDAAHFLRHDVTDSKRLVVNAQGEPLLSVAPSVTAEKLDAIKGAFAAKRDALSWNANGYPPVGVRFERVLLEREPGFDTFSYYALIPTGGAVYPGAKAGDPNEAPQVWIERTGGFAGITMFGGPIDVD